jgi:hypothetical protein
MNRVKAEPNFIFLMPTGKGTLASCDPFELMNRAAAEDDY